MKISVDVKGTDKLLNALRGMATTTDVKKAVRLNGSELQRKMKRHASFKGHYQNGKFIPPTGATKRSIGLEITDFGYTAIVKPDTLYSPYLEYGTRKMSAQPFVRPAFREQEPLFIKDLERLLKSLK